MADLSPIVIIREKDKSNNFMILNHHENRKNIRTLCTPQSGVGGGGTPRYAVKNTN